MKDDAKVREAVAIFYDVLPAPARLALRVTLGEEGLHKLGLQVRDFMLSERVREMAVVARDVASEGAGAMKKAAQDFSQGLSEKYGAAKAEADTRAGSPPAIEQR